MVFETSLASASSYCNVLGIRARVWQVNPATHQSLIQDRNAFPNFVFADSNFPIAWSREHELCLLSLKLMSRLPVCYHHVTQHQVSVLPIQMNSLSAFLS
jgi:hypothetical protein